MVTFAQFALSLYFKFHFQLEIAIYLQAWLVGWKFLAKSRLASIKEAT